jgi:signal transduction histidine kinase
MGQFELILVATSAVAVLAMLGMAFVTGRTGVTLARAKADRDRALVAEAATMRVLRMSVADLRADTMRLLGYAERLVERDGREPPSHVSGILSMVQQLLQHADDMQDYAVPSAASRRLQPESIPLRALIEDSIATVAATLGPSARHWRVGAGLEEITLLGDRRALSHVLGRVLSNAARHSRHDDWVDVSLERWPTGIALVIEDEGAGLVASRRPLEPGEKETRGIGLGLVLARVLMEAHGGQLTIESVARVGTKVTVRFPIERVAAPGDARVVRLAA